MIVITGAAGFIGSYLAGYFLEMGEQDLVLVDDFSQQAKVGNWKQKTTCQRIERNDFVDWLAGNDPEVVIHLGARTDTTEFDLNLLMRMNFDYTKAVWEICTEKQIPLIYASSAATYGGGEHDYNDDHESPYKLEPLNPYGVSKNEFDKWALKQMDQPESWAGLKFFNVYGPNEYHKGRMASVIWHAFKQISETEGMKLFRSHNPNYKDGEQLRDFIYVQDVARVIYHLYKHPGNQGLLNLGTGQARTFLDLVRATFAAMDKPEQISFIDTPEDIRDKYQYFTEANMAKLRTWGYNGEFTALEDGVKDYVRNYLMAGNKIY